METLSLANLVSLSPILTNFSEKLVPELFHKFVEIRVYGRQCTSECRLLVKVGFGTWP